MIHVEQEKQRVTQALTQEGVPQKDAETVAECLVCADSYGVTSHGTATLGAHIQRIQRGGYNLNPTIKTLRETAAFAVIDGDNAIGMVSATHCISYAMNKCQDSGVFTVFARNNNTLGPAFYYPLLCARAGYIGIVCTNSPAQMTPIGSKDKLLGTNPFSIVVPNGDEPIILDMATSVVAKSKFKEYKAQGKELPKGWAVDEYGKPTTDPDAAIRGSVLPMSGMKGYGMALMIDVLSGVLSGAAWLNKVGRFYSEDGTGMNVGYCFTVIDPKQVLGEEYETAIAEFVTTIRNSSAVDGGTVALPGDDRLQHWKDNAKLEKE